MYIRFLLIWVRKFLEFKKQRYLLAQQRERVESYLFILRIKLKFNG